jgi:hypothetical protein
MIIQAGCFVKRNQGQNKTWLGKSVDFSPSLYYTVQARPKNQNNPKEKGASMKKLLFLSLAVLLSFGLAHALLPSFGVKGGVNMATYAGTDANITGVTKTSKMGLGAGAFVCLDLIAIKIQPEVLFSQKGAKYEVSGASYTQSLSYVEVPVLLKFSFGKIIVPSVYAGPAFGTLMSAKQTGEMAGVSISGDIKDQLNGTDLGLVFGAEVKLPVKLSVEARYNMGLSKIPKAISGVQPDVKNSTVSVMLGYYMF